MTKRFNPYNLHGQAFKDYIESEKKKKKIELIPVGEICKDGVCYPRKYVSIDTHLEHLMKGDVIVSYEGDMEVEIASEATQDGGMYRYQALAPMHYLTDEIECQSIWNVKSKVPRPRIVKIGEEFVLDCVGLSNQRLQDIKAGTIFSAIPDMYSDTIIPYARVIGKADQPFDYKAIALQEFNLTTVKWVDIKYPEYDIKWVQAGDFELLEKYEIV